MDNTTANTTPETVDPLDNPKVNRAAYDFGMLVTKIKTDTQGLSLRSLNRILMNVVEYPFNKNVSKLSPKERDIIFHIALANQCKDIMLDSLRQADGVLKEQLEQVKNESLTEGEEKNEN
jgi:hypothetical protein